MNPQLVRRLLCLCFLLVVGLSLSPVAAQSPDLAQQTFQGILTQASRDLTRNHSGPVLSGNGQWVAFTNNTGLFLAPADGSAAPLLVTAQPWLTSDVAADGAVAFVEGALAESSRRIKLYRNGDRLDLTPCAQHPQLTEQCLRAQDIAISGDGQWIFVTSTGHWPCVAKNLGSEQSPYWVWECDSSYDPGQRGNYEVWRIATATGAATRLSDIQSNRTTRGARFPAADFAGSKVVFTCWMCNDSAETAIYVVNGSGGGQLRLGATYASSEWDINYGRISDDGQWILFPGYLNGEWGLDVIRPDGGSHQRVIRDQSSGTAGVPAEFDINYDGSLVAHQSVQTGPTGANYTTWLVNRDGAGLRTLSPQGYQVKNPRFGYDGSVTVISDQDMLDKGVQPYLAQVFVFRQAASKAVSPAHTLIGGRLVYTVTLRHGQSTALSAALTDPLPQNTAIVTGSVWSSKGAAVYNPTLRQITWNGSIAAQETVTVAFAVTSTCTAPPPPATIQNSASVVLGSETLHPVAATTVELPSLDFAALADSPADGAVDVRIEAGNLGPLLRWHDRSPGLACGADPTVADVAYRVYRRQPGQAWQERGAYPNCARQVQLNAMDLTCQSSGDPTSYEWQVVAYDVKYPCREPAASVFRFTTASCRPTLQVKPEFALDAAYYLGDLSVPNPIRVEVDWNGPAYETPDATPPYGQVHFDLNGARTVKTGESWGAAHTVNMGNDFKASVSCPPINTLRVWAEAPAPGGVYQSLETSIQPAVFPFSGWVNWLETLHLGSFQTKLAAPVVEYTYEFTYPEEPFETTWTPPAWVPYLGGRKLGINDTQATADALGRSDGAGSVGVRGQTSMDFAAFTSEGSLHGQGDASLQCGKSLDLEQATLDFDITIGREFEMGLVDVIPGLRAAEQWPVVGRIVRWVNSVAQVKTAITPGVKINTVFRDRDDQLKFDQGAGRAEIATQATLSTQVCEGLGASVFGGGTPYVDVQVPKDPGYLKQVGIDLEYGANFEAWAFEAEYKRDINCKYPPGDCAQKEEGEPEGGGQLAQPAWRVIPRDYAAAGYAGAEYARPVYLLSPRDELGLQARLGASAVTTETVLLTNIYRRPEPTLATSDARRLLAYVHDDTSKPHGRGTEVRVFTFNGSSWSGPTSLTSDSQPDFAPALAFDASGDGVLVWERSRLAAGITPTLDITFAQSLEIAARAWNGSTWSSAVTLTNDGLMDHAPRLSAGNDGAVMALWQTNDGTDVLGAAAHPLTLTYAVWNGSAWGAPAAALTGLHEVVNVAFAAYSSTQAALVYARDMDGLLTTTTDLDLFYSTFNGSAWSGPTRLTNDAITDTTPSLAYDAAGTLHLAWLRNRNLVWLRNSWNANDAQTVRAGSAEGGFLGFRLSRASNGNLALVWQAMQDSGANLAYSVYDAAASAWSVDQSLMSNSSVEAAHSPAFGSDGNLYLAYQKIAVNLVTQTVQISPTLTMTVTNLPQRGQSDLAFLAHTIGRDLAFDSLTAAPANPAPGRSVTLTAVLRNAGDLSIAAPQVTFYDGATPIVTQTLALTLTAGYTTKVQTVWVLPALAVSHTLRAAADPAGQVVETDETNNVVTLTTTLPDLAVDHVYATYAPNAITVTARLSNTGALSLGAPFTVALRLTDPVTGALAGSIRISDNIAAGGQITVTLPLTRPASLAGRGNQAWLTADAGNAVTEADENNNTGLTALNILPDLTLTAADIRVGQILLRNQGYVTATNVTVEARRAAVTGTLVASGTAALIAPGAGVSLTVALAPGSYKLFVKADPNGAIPETDESNNLAVNTVAVHSQVYLPVVLRQ